MCRKRIEIVYLLFDKGADIDAKDKWVQNPLHIACEKEQERLVKYFRENGNNLEVKDKDQQTPLHIVSKIGDSDIIKYLVFKGANKRFCS